MIHDGREHVLFLIPSFFGFLAGSHACILHVTRRFVSFSVDISFVWVNHTSFAFHVNKWDAIDIFSLGVI